MRSISAAWVAVLWLGASTASSQQLALVDRAELAGSERGGHEPGRYAGVKLGGNESPPIASKPGSPVTVTWPGFQMKPEGGSVVFLQSNAVLNVQSSKAEHKLIVELGEVRVEGTNRLPLDTHFFNTPVTRVELKRGHKSTRLELSLRADVEARIETAQAKSGYYFVYIHLPPGDYLPRASPPANAVAAPQPDTADRTVTSQTDAIDEAALAAELPPGMAPTKPAPRKSSRLGLSTTLRTHPQ
jgi:hypothetical protein